ncbi:MAG: ATP-binding protein [Leptospiraceae bacterium]|nr:ATP-binding protein [Leptospiraceae bacterium]MCB1304023.1 ATP-binding protein [Leptospiraceae bacterium]
MTGPTKRKTAENKDDSLRSRLQANAPHYGVEGCPQCQGLGLVFDPLAGKMGAYELCQCNKERCQCGGEPPYLYFDAKKNGMVPCPARGAYIALERIRRLNASSGVPARFQNRFLDTIDVKDRGISLLIALDHAVETIFQYGLRNRPDAPQLQGLYLYGSTGTGKSHIACTIVNELIRLYQVEAHYAKISRDILNRIRESFNTASDSYGMGGRIEKELASHEALVIDDFGVHRESPWVNSTLYDLIDSRYERNLLTILTSNEPMDSWKDVFGGRVYSRLRQLCIEIHLDGDDYRLKDSRSIT